MGLSPKVAERFEMLKLITEGQTPNNPTIPIRWCIEPSDRAKLIKFGADNIHILISVAYKNGAEDRQLRPLDEAMTYVSFRFAGKHTIFARLVWWPDLKQMRSNLLQRSDRWKYQIEVLNYDRNTLLDHFGGVHHKCFDLPAAEPLDIMFGKGFFAKEPPKWVSDWVDGIYTFPSVDSCQFRRRAHFAFLIQPFIWLILEVFFRLVALVPLLVGAVLLARNLNPRAVLSGKPNEVWPKEWVAHRYGRSLWIARDDKGRLKLHRVFVSPLFFLCLGVLMYYSSISGVVLFLVSFLIVFVPLFLVILFALNKIGERVSARKEFKQTPGYLEKVRLEVEENRRRRLDEAYRYLTCPKANEIQKATTIGSLPPERRTLRLRFYDLKRGLCRPYAR